MVNTTLHTLGCCCNCAGATQHQFHGAAMMRNTASRPTGKKSLLQVA